MLVRGRHRLVNVLVDRWMKEYSCYSSSSANPAHTASQNIMHLEPTVGPRQVRMWVDGHGLLRVVLHYVLRDSICTTTVSQRIGTRLNHSLTQSRT